MAETIDELLVSLGIDVDNKSFKEADALMKGVKSSMAAFATLAGVWGLKKLTDELSVFVNEIMRVSKLENVNHNGILRLGSAFKSVGGDVNDAIGMISKLNKVTSDIKWGKINDEALIHLPGVIELQNYEGNPMAAMLRLSQIMSDASPEQRRLGGAALGLGSKDISLLSGGVNAILKQFKLFDERSVGITPDMAKNSAEYAQAMQNLGTSMDSLKNEMVDGLMPGMTDLANTFDKWILNNKSDILEGFKEALPYLKATAIGVGALVAAKGITSLSAGGLALVRANPLLAAFLLTQAVPGDSGNFTTSQMDSMKIANRKKGWSTSPTSVELKDMVLKDVNSPKMRVFLDYLAYAEGTDKYDNSGYGTLFGGEQFDDYSQHPNKNVPFGSTTSTAAGRYQILKKTYDEVAKIIGITDFSPESQDMIAHYLITNRGAGADIDAGDYESAINKLGGVWASLPSSTYGQPTKSWEDTYNVIDDLNARSMPYFSHMTSPKNSKTDQSFAVTVNVQGNSSSSADDIARVVTKEIRKMVDQAIIATGKDYR